MCLTKETFSIIQYNGNINKIIDFAQSKVTLTETQPLMTDIINNIYTAALGILLLWLFWSDLQSWQNHFRLGGFFRLVHDRWYVPMMQWPDWQITRVSMNLSLPQWQTDSPISSVGPCLGRENHFPRTSIRTASS